MASGYTTDEVIAAVTELLDRFDPDRLVSMPRDDFVLKFRDSLPYGGEYLGAEGVERFMAQIRATGGYYDSFTPRLKRVLVADDHLVAPIVITSRGKKTGETTVFENLWLFETRDGNFVRAQVCADTAAANRTTG
ncbi:nuclear transport factor 2 family protein [Amycolatopsis sp. NPDC049253]|uniref:nuclear transport factor 2 family protein n=1 Tax=Amycolatopsis sp. NPDC049253 TaxID=3155274 RepID=UPI00342E95CA